MGTERTFLPMTTGIERVYKRTRDGHFQEVYQHWIYFLNPDGSKHSAKLDKVLPGRLFKVATHPRELGVNGLVEYHDPETGNVLKLVAISR